MRLVLLCACSWLALELGPLLLLNCWTTPPPRRWVSPRARFPPLKEVNRQLLGRSTNAGIDVPWGQTEAEILPGNVRGSFPEERTFELDLETWVRILTDCASWGGGEGSPSPGRSGSEVWGVCTVWGYQPKIGLDPTVAGHWVRSEMWQPAKMKSRSVVLWHTMSSAF